MIGRALLLWTSMLACDESAPKNTEGSATTKPDVLLVVLDTVRADKLSTYGYHRPTSPQLDAVAAAGVTFEIEGISERYVPYYGTSPIRARIRFGSIADGAGHLSDHYDVVQVFHTLHMLTTQSTGQAFVLHR